jgi:Armadillo/beta-catenin-like repeat
VSHDPRYSSSAIFNFPGGIPALLDMLKATSSESRRLHAVVTAVLCNVSVHDAVRDALTSAGASQILVQFLDCDTTIIDSVDVASRAAVVIADLADAGDENRRLITNCGAITALVRLLDSNLEDILANAVNAIRMLCAGDVPDIQMSFRTSGAIPPLVEFLSVSSGMKYLIQVLLSSVWKIIVGE